MSSDLFPLISDFAVLDFCELYTDVHCPIVLKLNLIEAQEAELGHFESDHDDCLEDADERNLQFITGKPVWCKTREDEHIFALDDAVINELNIVSDEELLSPEVTSLDTINHIVLKITEVMKNSGLSTGLFRDNTRRKNKHNRKTNSVSGSRQNVKRKERLFLEQRINICA